jgi:cobalt-zinc-cadmium efflux system outer membrane protein
MPTVAGRPTAVPQPIRGGTHLEEAEPRSASALSAPVPENPHALLTLEELEQVALECNPTLVQARMAIRAAEGDCIQAGLYPNPNVGYIADEVGNDGTEGLMGGGVGQEVVTAGKLRLSRAVAAHQIEQARYAWEAQRWRVVNDVRRGYYETLLAQKRIEVHTQLFGIEEQILKSTKQLRGAKEVSEVDVLQAQVEAESAKLNLSEARDQHEAAWRRLAAVLGRPELEPAMLAGDVTANLPVHTWDDSLDALISQSPELAHARAGVERARCEFARQCAERTPNFEVGTAVKYDTGSRFTVVDLELRVPLQIFNRNQGNIVRAQADLVAAEHEVRRVELELRERLATVFKEYTNARRRASTYTQSILPCAKRSLDLTSAGYREGEFAYVNLLTAQRTFYDKTLEYLSSLEELWRYSVEIEGLLLQGALQAPGGGK